MALEHRCAGEEETALGNRWPPPSRLQLFSLAGVRGRLSRPFRPSGRRGGEEESSRGPSETPSGTWAGSSWQLLSRIPSIQEGRDGDSAAGKKTWDSSLDSPVIGRAVEASFKPSPNILI